MRLSTRSSLALRLLMLCAEAPTALQRKRDAALELGASENHLAVVINRLGQMGVLETRRGRNGGFCLGRPAAQISIGSVLRQLETDLPFLNCATKAEICPLYSACALRDHLLRALEAFFASLDPLRLSDLDGHAFLLDALLGDNGAVRPKPFRMPCVTARG